MNISRINILKISGGILGVMILASVVAHKTGLLSQNVTGKVLGEMKSTDEEAVSILIETAGENQIEGTEDIGISWPGEIISLGDIEVQPQREGAIVEWKVNIGQKVFNGQVLGRLSAPPKTPELIKMLADQAEGLAKANGHAPATTDFAKKNIEQLHTLRDALQKNIAAVGSTLEGTKSAGDSILARPRNTIEQLQSVVAVKQQYLRKTIEQLLVAQIQKLTGNINFNSKSFSSVYLKLGLGLLDNNYSLSNYEIQANKLFNELKDQNALPVEAAKNYTQATIRLIGASITTETLDQSQLDDLRKMANEDQINFLDALKEYEEAKSELAMQEIEYKLTYLEQEKDYAEQLKEINEKIAMLEREQQMALAEVKAAQAAYYTVASSFTGGLNIVAPQTGTISAIFKKNGDFVEPGMSVASINNNNANERFVRFRIPSNMEAPKHGAILTIMRSGYPRDGKKVKLIGIGTALDENGAFVADAQFIDPVDWPVRISVRVMPPQGSMANTLIPFTAVWWDSNAQANIWLVTEEGKIRPQQIKTGKVLGDKIEVTEGIQKGNRYVAKVVDGLVVGMALNDIKPAENQKSGEQEKKTDGAGDLMKGMIMDN